ncbi:hypothetical protein P3T76_009685 [Phytophthora citrophthora]|uniref:Uncharacterized protein n=1 Tax=Phytophthora citrophthora TaxID=4793 RepID=A0AAD9GGE5_9STRA|nr:hypothetical protein P3T76_009685 [Phytophthora citrophthora]
MLLRSTLGQWKCTRVQILADTHNGWVKAPKSNGQLNLTKLLLFASLLDNQQREENSDQVLLVVAQQHVDIFVKAITRYAAIVVFYNAMHPYFKAEYISGDDYGDVPVDAPRTKAARDFCQNDGIMFRQWFCRSSLCLS